jgi:hypothetical protein
MHMAALDCRKFVTIEPIMQFDCEQLADLIAQADPEWVNIGADSKGHHLPEPTYGEVMILHDELLRRGIEVRKKCNLERLP